MKPYIEIIKGVTDYDQFRFIDLSGKEIFRAERKGIDSIVLEDLQDKHNRRYFKEGVELSSGKLYLSQINLNREYGYIERPYKPVLRVVAPVFDIDKKKIGVVVINFKMERILNRLKSNIVDNNFYLVDDNLNIITSNTDREHIPFEISDSVVPLNKKYGLSEAVFKKDTTFFKNNHIWSIKTLNLNGPDLTSDFGSRSPIEIVTPANWAVVQELPPKFLHSSLMLLYFSVGVFNVLAIALLMTVAYFFIKNRIEKERYFKEMEANNAILSQKSIQLQNNNKQISKINRRLEIRNKQLNEFNYLVSHNLKAPVSSMSVIVSMIEKEQEQEKINELLPKLSQVAESISDLTKDMGNYVSVLNEKNLKVEEVELSKLINQVKKECFETLLDAVDFKVSVDFKAWQEVVFSKFYMQSILQNLLSNAIKYRRSDVTSFIHFETAFEGQNKVLLVKDNGIGINLEKHGENIFKLYKRFHRDISGNGVGLFLVKSQLETLNATITVESEENKGTTFKIQF
ncbi:sensor histidine kinase [Lacinutrix sp. Hel_I_90]|uniref:sensor histidine kinase n=1 Tax=Lacinutrix sp. Hel_I_90 TaxID=1249999 RepID=UPI0018CDC760|nr:sensor histidine kinase [Lacinutrix sp. Hel_I_90]